MDYKHRYERDTFAALNRAGYEALPQCAKAHLKPHHSLKLRTTEDVDKRNGQKPPFPVLGRIVKVRLGDLDIHCPRMDFDCRISANIEVDLNNRPDLDPALIVVPPAENEVDAAGAAPSRFKDRLSYKHLAYSIDLTQVTLPTGAKSHELEVEIDTTKLRAEALGIAHNGGDSSAFETLVDGFVNNVLVLIKAVGEPPVPFEQVSAPGSAISTRPQQPPPQAQAQQQGGR